MNILGISAFYHDSAAALVRDGEIIAAAQEERFTRRKHDPRFPENAAAYCLREAGIGVSELDAVVFYEKPHTPQLKADKGWQIFRVSDGGYLSPFPLQAVSRSASQQGRGKGNGPQGGTRLGEEDDAPARG